MNELESTMPVPMDGVEIRVPYPVVQARIIGSDIPVKIRREESCTVLAVGRVELFHMIEAES